MSGDRPRWAKALAPLALLAALMGALWWQSIRPSVQFEVQSAAQSNEVKPDQRSSAGAADKPRGGNASAGKTASDKAAGSSGRSGGGRGNASGPIFVEVAQTRAAKTTNDIRAIGSLQSDESVKIAPEINGRISEIIFNEGQPVQKGAVLLKLDDALAAAELADTTARLKLASANNDRARALSKTGNVTGRGRDEATANFETAQAAVELAKTRLSKHILNAPFDGIAGIRTASVGAFINAGTAVTNLEKIDVLKVDFKVPEANLQAIKVGQTIEVTVDAIADSVFDAAIYAINPLLDVNGRALEVRAKLDNKDARLRPGLFARINIKGLQTRDVVMIPEAAVVPRGGDTFAFLVEDGKAVEKKVQLGQRAGAEVEIVEGVAANATIVTAGQQKLRDGVAVQVVPTTAQVPDPSLSDPSQSNPRGLKASPVTTGSTAGSR